LTEVPREQAARSATPRRWRWPRRRACPLVREPMQ